MKKRLSVCGLGLRLTGRGALIITLVTCLLQGWLFWRQQSVWGGVEFDFGYRIALEHIIENNGIETAGTTGVLVLFAVIAACVSSGQTGMTLRRLRISEWEVTAWWSLLFTGYFILYWAAQLAVLLWMFRVYSGVSGWGTIDLFISAHTSPYFHLVLPLSEPWAVARNIFLCIAFGVMAAVNPMEGRRGGKPFMIFVVYFLAKLFLPNNMASQVADIAAIAVLGCVLVSYIVTVRGRVKNED